METMRPLKQVPTKLLLHNASPKKELVAQLHCGTNDARMNADIIANCGTGAGDVAAVTTDALGAGRLGATYVDGALATSCTRTPTARIRLFTTTSRLNVGHTSTGSKAVSREVWTASAASLRWNRIAQLHAPSQDSLVQTKWPPSGTMSIFQFAEQGDNQPPELAQTSDCMQEARIIVRATMKEVCVERWVRGVSDPSPFPHLWDLKLGEKLVPGEKSWFVRPIYSMMVAAFTMMGRAEPDNPTTTLTPNPTPTPEQDQDHGMSLVEAPAGYRAVVGSQRCSLQALQGQ
uniref:Uncharacterized protein n=1 Tax=Timema douglasi TaxID=61478 RepID=A0A7R8VG08_TIMDO|nr:unnamed protein product [Timema douglasi]